MSLVFDMAKSHFTREAALSARFEWDEWKPTSYFYSVDLDQAALDAAVVAACSHGMVKRLSDYARRDELEYARGKHIDPETGDVLPYGETGELVFTSITKEAFPVIRYRTRDITSLNPEPCICGRTHIRMKRVSGRSDDMLIIRGVNVFPSAVRDVVGKIGGAVSGAILIRPPVRGVKQAPPLPVTVELAKGAEADPDLAAVDLGRGVAGLEDDVDQVEGDVTAAPCGPG